MAYERKDGDGVLFKNDRKTEDKHPDYKGEALIGGVEMDVAAWLKTAKSSGQKFFSLSIRPKREQGFNQAPQARSAPQPQRGGGSRWDTDDGEPPF
jgi:uncharacterized protein (DUF736 family)